MAAMRYINLFADLHDKKQGAFVPFVTLGDPSYEQSLAIIRTLADHGADALELGFPFSDPLADGPVIQGANLRALQASMTPALCFQLIQQIRSEYPELPIGLLLYANLAYANGLEQFYQQAATVGVDSILIADVPVEEAAPFIAAAKQAEIAPIFIAPPNSDRQTIQQISEAGRGYTYLLARAGVTGTETTANMPIESIVDQLREFNAPLPLLGFGISQPEHVQQAIAGGAAGAISGSAVVKIIAAHLQQPEVMLKELARFTQAMKAATHF